MPNRVEELIGQYAAKAYSIAYRFCGDQATAEDIVQDAFVKVLHNKDKYNPELNFESWVFSIIRNIYIDTLRRSKFYDTAASENLDLFADSSNTPDEQASAKDTQLEVRLFLAKLHPKLRAVLVLVDMEGYPYEKAAQILDWPLGTVCVRLQRARKVLRKLILDSGLGE